jgi:hypothetical protein
VSARVKQVFPLEVNFSASTVLCKSLGMIEVRRAASKLSKLVIQLFLELRIFTSLVISLCELEERCH